LAIGAVTPNSGIVRNGPRLRPAAAWPAQAWTAQAAGGRGSSRSTGSWAPPAAATPWPGPGSSVSRTA